MKISNKITIYKVLIILAVIAITTITFPYENTFAAGNSMQSGTKTAQSAEFGPYMKRMQDKIKSNWNPPTQDMTAQIVVKYRILKNGTLDSYGILSSSGSQELDNAAIEALRVSSPFEPLPQSFNKESILVQFTFDYQPPKKNIANFDNQNNIIPTSMPEVSTIRIKSVPGEAIQVQKIATQQKVLPEQPIVREKPKETFVRMAPPVEDTSSTVQTTSGYDPQKSRPLLPLPPKNTQPRTVAVPPPLRETPSVDVDTYAQGELLDLDKSKIDTDEFKNTSQNQTQSGVIIRSASPTTANSYINNDNNNNMEFEEITYEEVEPVNTTLSAGINKVAVPVYRKKMTRPVNEEQYPDLVEENHGVAQMPGTTEAIQFTPVRVTDFSEYMRKVQRKITKKWKPPLSDYSTKVVVNYVIHKNGELGDYYISESSGNSRMDISATEALKKAAPFDPLPSSFQENSVDVKFTFDYNVYKNKSEKQGIKELEDKHR